MKCTQVIVRLASFLSCIQCHFFDLIRDALIPKQVFCCLLYSRPSAMCLAVHFLLGISKCELIRKFKVLSYCASSVLIFLPLPFLQVNSKFVTRSDSPILYQWLSVLYQYVPVTEDLTNQKESLHTTSMAMSGSSSFTMAELSTGKLTEKLVFQRVLVRWRRRLGRRN